MSDVPSLLKSIRGETTDAYNRLHSIREDANFVLEVADRHRLYPLFANQRCGAWYTDPSRARPEFVYFKSTDGHFGQWTFNLRRANTHLLPIIRDSGGIVIVDSTRGGKSMPDALSKTIPLWCAVINEATRADKTQTDNIWDTHGELNTPPTCVSSSEHEQMACLVPELAQTLLKSSFQPPHLDKPLRPFWVTARSSPLTIPTSCLPVICVSASKQVADGMERRTQNYTYVQGAADDHESWSQGLTPRMFWGHQDTLLSCNRDSTSETIKTIVRSLPLPSQAGARERHAIDAVGGQILFCTLEYPGELEEHVAVIQVQQTKLHLKTTVTLVEPRHLLIQMNEGKKDHLQLVHKILPAVDSFGHQWLDGIGQKLAVIDADGTYDASIGILMLLLARFFDEDGKECPKGQPLQVAKGSLRRRLEWIQQSVPRSNPSRTTMKRVNEFGISSMRQIHRKTHEKDQKGVSSGD